MKYNGFNFLKLFAIHDSTMKLKSIVSIKFESLIEDYWLSAYCGDW